MIMLGKIKKLIALAFILLYVTTVTFAQEKDVDINNAKKETPASDWYQQPWVWGVGSAAFLLLLLAIFKNGGKKSNSG
jgi:hypothetical protein